MANGNGNGTNETNNVLLKLLYSVLEKQGIAVLLVLIGTFWLVGTSTGFLPLKLCESPGKNEKLVEEMQSDRRQTLAAMQKISEAISEIARGMSVINARDAIRTCGSIVDKEARTACIQVALQALTATQK